MSKIHEDYYLRKYYLENSKMPTQKMMTRKMGETLSSFYFNEMNDKLKALAGIELRTPLGAGNWCASPADILKGKNALKSVTKDFISHLKYINPYVLGEQVLRTESRLIKLRNQKVVAQNTQQWKEIIKKKCEEHEEIFTKEIVSDYKRNINVELKKCYATYMESMKQIENILRYSATNAVKQFREQTWELVKGYYKMQLQKQEIDLTDKYRNVLHKKKDKLRHKFIYNLQLNRTKAMAVIHDVKVEKLQTVEKLRNYFAYQNLACQLYVFLMEKEECERQKNELVNVHTEKINKLNTKMEVLEEELCNAKKKETKQRENYKYVEEKVYEIIRKFQLFVTYCLKLMPEHAEFFVNMENLMFLQLNESLDNSSSESILFEEKPTEIQENDKVETYLIFDNNPDTLNVPMFMINKHCVCAVCGNNKDLTKIRDSAEKLFEEKNFDYSCFKPVKCKSQHEIKELKLESSLMRIIKNEIKYLECITNPCCHCKKKECNCSLRFYSEAIAGVDESTNYETIYRPRRSVTKQYLGECPKSCKCQELAKKELIERLPPYMLKVPNSEPVLCNYEPCTPQELHHLITQSKIEKATKEKSIQHTEFDVIYDYCKELYISDKIVVSENAMNVNHAGSSSTIVTKSPRMCASEVTSDFKELISSEFELLKQIFPEKRFQGDKHIHFSSEHILCHYSM